MDLMNKIEITEIYIKNELTDMENNWEEYINKYTEEELLKLYQKNCDPEMNDLLYYIENNIQEIENNKYIIKKVDFVKNFGYIFQYEYSFNEEIKNVYNYFQEIIKKYNNIEFYYESGGVIYFYNKEIKYANLIESIINKYTNIVKYKYDYDLIKNMDIFHQYKIITNNIINEYNIEEIIVKKLFGKFDYNISFKYDNIFVIHAPNGCGKSTLIDTINNLFHHSTDDQVTMLAKEIVIKEKNIYNNNIFNLRLQWDDNKIIFTNNNEKTTPKILSFLNCTNIYHLQNEQTFCTFIKEIQSNEKNCYVIDEKTNLYNEILKKFFHYEKEIKLREEWMYIKDKYDGYNDEDFINRIFDIKCTEKNEFNIPYVYNEGDKIPFVSLSTGEKNIIIDFFRIIYEQNFHKTRFYLIDEPEISLHVEWQEMFLEVLYDLCKKMPNTKILIATHSSYIVNSPYVKVGVVEYE